MSEHDCFLSMIVAGAAQIGVFEQRARGTVLCGRVVRFAGEKCDYALAVENAQLDGAGRDRFEASRIDAAIRPQNPETGAEPLLGMWPAGEHGADQALGVRSDLAGPTAEPIRRPLGVAPMRARHVVGVRAVLAAHVAALVDRDALAAMEHLDDLRGDANLDLGANQRMRNRIQEVVDLVVIIEIDPRAPPFRALPIFGRQRGEDGAFDLLEQLAPAQTEMAHGTFVHALHDQRRSGRFGGDGTRYAAGEGANERRRVRYDGIRLWRLQGVRPEYARCCPGIAYYLMFGGALRDLILDFVEDITGAGEDGVQFGAVRRRLREHLPRCGIIAADAVQALEKTGESTFLISHEFVWISRFRGGTSLNVLETRSFAENVVTFLERV